MVSQVSQISLLRVVQPRVVGLYDGLVVFLISQPILVKVDFNLLILK